MPGGKTPVRCPPLRRLPAAAVWYALAALVVVAGPAAVVLLLGTPELALPSEWADTRSRIADGTYAAGHVVDIVSGLGLLAWLAGLWLVVTGVRKRRRRRHRDSAEESDGSAAGLSRTNGDNEADEPWYRQGAPIFDEPFTDEYPRVVVPPDETADSPWQPAPVAAGVDEPFGMPPPEPVAADMVADAEVIAGAGLTGDAPTTGDADTMSDAADPDPDDPPMIVPVRAYYFTRAGDTLRSISAQFLNTPMRWEELRSLNAASPGVSVMGADSLLPVGTALALPGDPLPWGRPDPVYLWTLAEKFLFTAWGREPTPEEVVPFWRGLTGGAQLEAGAPPIQPEHLTAPASTEPPPPEAAPAPETTDEPTAESAPPEVAHKPEPAPEAATEETPAEPPATEVAHEPEPAPEAAVEEIAAEPPATEVAAEPPWPPEVARRNRSRRRTTTTPSRRRTHGRRTTTQPKSPHEPAPAPVEPPLPDGFVPAPPPAPGVEPATSPT